MRSHSGRSSSPDANAQAQRGARGGRLVEPPGACPAVPELRFGVEGEKGPREGVLGGLERHDGPRVPREPHPARLAVGDPVAHQPRQAGRRAVAERRGLDGDHARCAQEGVRALAPGHPVEAAGSSSTPSARSGSGPRRPPSHSRRPPRLYSLALSPSPSPRSGHSVARTWRA